MKYLLLFLLSLSLNAKMINNVSLSSLLDTTTMSFIPHVDKDKKSFNNALALNVNYSQIKRIRRGIEKHTELKLNYFKGWNKLGEAHVTVITPPEFVFTLSKYMKMREINKLATDQNIQVSELSYLGLGKADKEIDGKIESTFFVIVESEKLRRIRLKVYELYKKRGGSPQKFDPSWFFPHITIGYTKRDLHASDGVLKNLKHSFFGEVKLK